MEPFFEFCNAVLYAVLQIRIEYRAWKSYRRTLSPRTSVSEPELTDAAKTKEVYV